MMKKCIKATHREMLRMSDEQHAEVMRRRKGDATQQNYLHQWGFSPPVDPLARYKVGGNKMPELEIKNWLKGEDVAPEAELEFTDVGEAVEIHQGEGKEPKKAFEIGVRLPNGEDRVWTMNFTSQRAVAQTYGKNTDSWVGKKVRVFVSEQNVSGQMKKVIYARVPV